MLSRRRVERADRVRRRSHPEIVLKVFRVSKKERSAHKVTQRSDVPTPAHNTTSLPPHSRRYHTPHPLPPVSRLLTLASLAPRTTGVLEEPQGSLPRRLGRTSGSTRGTVRVNSLHRQGERQVTPKTKTYIKECEEEVFNETFLTKRFNY